MRRDRWPRGVRILTLVLTLLGSSLAAGRAAGVAHAAPTQALFLTTEVQQLTLNNSADVWSGGTIVIGGQNVIIPRNLLIDFPANRLTLQQTFAGAPPACLATGESGLAQADSCNHSGHGAIASVAANRDDAGNLIAGDIFFQKGIENFQGVVTYINFTDGYFRVNGFPGDSATGVMIRINDPTGRQTVQQGLGCVAGEPNCSPDPRFTEDPDNYTSSFSDGYPLCIPSTVPRMFTDVLNFNGGGTGATVTALANPDGTGDILCPVAINRPPTPVGTDPVVGDSRRFAPIMLGDHVTVRGNFETIGGTRFLSAWSTQVSLALRTNGNPGQPDYMILSSAFVDTPTFAVNRIRDQFIGYTTAPTANVVIWSVHHDPGTNAPHEFPLASSQGCDTVAGAGTCSNAIGPHSFIIKGTIPFAKGTAQSIKEDPCAQLRADPLFAAKNLCPGGSTLANEFSIMSPVPHELQARTRLKITGGAALRTLDITGKDAMNGQYLFPMGIGLGGINIPTFAEVNVGLLFTPIDFEGIPWNLDRRLSPNGCVGPCELTKQLLDPFPVSLTDPRNTTFAPNLPTGPYNDPNYTASPLTNVSNRIFSFVDPALGNFNGNSSLLPYVMGNGAMPGSGNPPVPAVFPILPTPVLPTAANIITGFTPPGGPVGTTVIIDGNGLAGATAVTFGGVPAAIFSNISNTQVSAVVPVGAVSGPVSITTPAGVITSSFRFTVAPNPTITSVVPSGSPVTKTVTINGTGLVTATDVSFNGVSALFTVISDTAIRATVPATATTGPVTVTTLGGMFVGPVFTIIPADTIPPSIPTGLSATAAGAHQIVLNWTASTDNVGVTGYVVFRDGGAVPIASVTGTSFADTGLASNSTHTYTVAAFDAAGNQSAPSTSAMATTLNPVVQVTPLIIAFGPMLVGHTTAARLVRLTSAGTAPVQLASLTFDGPDFLVTTKTCGTIIAVGTSCTVSVAFKPTVRGVLAEHLVIADDAVGSPQLVKLTGTGF